MKIIKFCIAVCLVTFSLQGACDKLDVLRTKNARRLVTYIENIGYEVFGGKDTLLFKGGLANLLDKNPRLTPLTMENNKESSRMQPWYSLIECCKNLTRDLLESSKDTQRRNIYIGAYLKIESITQKIVLLSKFFDPKQKDHPQQSITTMITNITSARNDISPLYLFSLHELPIPLLKKRQPQEVIDDYKNLVKVDFFPANLFNAYKNAKENAIKKGGTIAPHDVFTFLIKSNVLAKIFDHTVDNQQYVTKLFVTMLEELVYQSKYYEQQGWFWQKNPPGTLTNEQISLAQEMINKLYSAFPSMESKFIEEKIKASADTFKAPLMLFAQTRVLLIVLDAYLRKVYHLQ